MHINCVRIFVRGHVLFLNQCPIAMLLWFAFIMVVAHGVCYVGLLLFSELLFLLTAISIHVDICIIVPVVHGGHSGVGATKLEV